MVNEVLVLIQVLQECTGYCSTPKLAGPPSQLLLRALASLLPNTAARLLTRCTLQQAEFVLVKVFLS